jgi:hypothetical protein
MQDETATEIRLLGADDSAGLARLAQLDTASPPPQPVLGAIVGGRLVAALSLATADSIADPFRRTAETLALLARRADQLRGDRGGRGVLKPLRRGRAGYAGRRDGAVSELAR